jgi:hypothetical protein
MAGPFSCEPNHQSVVASGRRLGGRSDFEIREQTEALIAEGVPASLIGKIVQTLVGAALKAG